MEKFFNNILAFYFPSYKQTVIIKGFRIKQLNVYYDPDAVLVVHQLAYFDNKGECHE